MIIYGEHTVRVASKTGLKYRVYVVSVDYYNKTHNWELTNHQINTGSANNCSGIYFVKKSRLTVRCEGSFISAVTTVIDIDFGWDHILYPLLIYIYKVSHEHMTFWQMK